VTVALNFLQPDAAGNAFEHRAQRGDMLAGSALERMAIEVHQGGSMMTRARITFAAAAIAALLLPGAAFAAGPLNRATFERCNQQAMQVAGVPDSQPSASPSMPSTGTGPLPGAISTPSTSGSTGSPTGGITSSPRSSASGASRAPSGAGSSSTAAVGGTDQQRLDQAVQAYRSCLQQ
jgi:hypothetical protein